MADLSEALRVFLDGVTPAKRRRDAETLLDLMARATGQSPQLYATAVGYGQYHYKYPSGREGDAPGAGFAPRKAATSIYLVDGIGRYEQQLEQLGPHTTGVGTESYRTLTSGTYTLRAREGGR